MHRLVRAAALLLFAFSSVALAAVSTSEEAIRIQRDEYGVPHVFATTTFGLYYGVGYAAAEDKLYPLEILRRTALGRVSEVLGANFAATDEAARRRIELADLVRQFRALKPEDQDIFLGFAAGFSARVARVLAERETLLPKDFMDAGFLPEAWSAADVLAIFVHSMALRFSDLNGELDNLVLFTALRQGRSPEQARQLFDRFCWTSDPDAPATIETSGPARWHAPAVKDTKGEGAIPNHLAPLELSALFKDRSARSLQADSATAHASNAWLLGAPRMAPGNAVLVNGPQMGDHASSYIWAVGLHGAGFNVVGSGPIGSPWLVFGFNGDIGWGATAGLGDTTDLYQEALSPADRSIYSYQGSKRRMRRRLETIGVKGTPSRTVEIFSTVHGTVELFDDVNHTAYARRRSWSGTEVQSLVAWVHAMRARDYATWRTAVSRVTLTVNNYFIDRRGHIAYAYLGRFPRRPSKQDFRLPARGDGSMEWSGHHSSTGNPHEIDPPGGLIVNWNNKPIEGYDNSDFMLWSRVDRVNVILDRLRPLEQASANDAWGIIRQTSFTDVTAGYFLKLIQQHRTRFRNASSLRAAELLLAWNQEFAAVETGRQPAGYLLYRAFLSALLREIFTPFLPAEPRVRAVLERRWLDQSPTFPGVGVKIAVRALQDDDVEAVLQGKHAADVLDAALDKAWIETVRSEGANPAEWSRPAQPHEFVRINYAGVPESTDSSSVSLPVMMNRGTENHMVVASAGKMTYCDVTPPGQSGTRAPNGALSDHALDQLELYRTFACKRQWLETAQVDTHTTSTEQLTARRAHP